jgi:hypothetical protein
MLAVAKILDAKRNHLVLGIGKDFKEMRGWTPLNT